MEKKKSSNVNKQEQKSEFENEEADENEEGDALDSQDKDESGKKNTKAKPFLKRKTRAVKFQKLNWNNVKGKTDCWTKKSARSQPREKSASRAARAQTQKPANEEKSKSKPRMKNKTFQNIKSRIDTGIRKEKDARFGSEGSEFDSFEMGNKYNIGEYANEGDQSYLNEKAKYAKQSNYPPTIDVRRYQLNAHQDEPNYNKNTSNVQYEVFSSDDDAKNREVEEYEYNEMHNHYFENKNMMNAPQYQQTPNSYEEETEEVHLDMGRNF